MEKVPLLHLANQRKIELVQDVAFGDIKISRVSEVMANVDQK